MQNKEREKLEELSGLSAEEAKNRLINSMKDEARMDAASYVNEIMDEAKLNANAQAKKTRLRVVSSDVKDVTSVLLKLPQVLRLLLMIHPRLS